jgi:pimeloyl-ACP methyl ester carboxylesterase
VLFRQLKIASVPLWWGPPAESFARLNAVPAPRTTSISTNAERPGSSHKRSIRPARVGALNQAKGMMGGAKAHYDGIVAFSQTDFTEDLKKINVPLLVMHSEDDQIVPYWLRALSRQSC